MRRKPRSVYHGRRTETIRGRSRLARPRRGLAPRELFRDRPFAIPPVAAVVHGLGEPTRIAGRVLRCPPNHAAPESARQWSLRLVGVRIAPRRRDGGNRHRGDRGTDSPLRDRGHPRPPDLRRGALPRRLSVQSAGGRQQCRAHDRVWIRPRGHRLPADRGWSPIAKPTKTSPIQSRSEVASRRTMPMAVLGPDRRSNARATRTPGRATTSPLTERPTAYEAGDTFDATSMSWNRNHCLLKYTLCEANRPVKEKVRTIAPMRDCIADAVSANTKMKITGRNENRLMTTRSIGSRRSGKASKRPMYSASRILDFNRSPHDLDERLFEARRFEGHLAFLAEPALDDREDLLGGLRLEDLGRGGAVPRRRLGDHAHPDAGVPFRLVDRPEEDRAPLVHDLRPGFLRHDRDVRPDGFRVREHVVAEDGGAAERGLELRRQDSQERGLPRAVPSEEAEDLALLDREGDVLEGFRPSGVRLAEAFDPNDFHGPRPIGPRYLRLLRDDAQQGPLLGRCCRLARRRKSFREICRPGGDSLCSTRVGVSLGSRRRLRAFLFGVRGRLDSLLPRPAVRLHSDPLRSLHRVGGRVNGRDTPSSDPTADWTASFPDV